MAGRDMDDEGPVDLDRNDPRVYFAAERTLLAWIRTGLSLMGLGFVVARFGLFLHEVAAVRPEVKVRPISMAVWVGAALILLGVSVNVLAAFQHGDYVRRMERWGAFTPGRVSLAVPAALALAALGVLMAAYILIPNH